MSRASSAPWFTRRVAMGAVGLCLLLSSATASAQISGNVDRLKVDLYGSNVDRAVAAASALGSLAATDAREALLAAMHLGAPPLLLSAMLEALGLHKNPDTVDLLRHYAHYRNPEIRVVALKSLGSVDDPRAAKVLIGALGDSHPMVRARAARVLGERRERSAERPLFKMLLRGDVSAAGPLGKVGGVETAKNLAELIGELPHRAVAVALGEQLKRKDFGPDPLRVEVVKALGNIPGADATAALVEYLASVPQHEARMSKTLAEKLLAGRQK